MPRVLYPEAARHDEQRMQVSMEQQIEYLRNPTHALEILSRGADPAQAQLCVICVHDKTGTCPFEGNRPLGACPRWKLNEVNPAATLERLEQFLLGAMVD